MNTIFRYLSVGAESVWAINPADEVQQDNIVTVNNDDDAQVYVRVLSTSDPKGKEWTKIDGSMKALSVGPTGVCWAVDQKEHCLNWILILISHLIFLIKY